MGIVKTGWGVGYDGEKTNIMHAKANERNKCGGHNEESNDGNLYRFTHKELQGMTVMRQ